MRIAVKQQKSPSQIIHLHEYHPGTSIPRRAFSSFEPAEVRGSIEKLRGLNESMRFGYDDHYNQRDTGSLGDKRLTETDLHAQAFQNQ